jgi:hypothetical protein
VWHSVQGQTRIGASEKNTSQGNPFRREALPDNKNYPERLLDDPMLEIKNPQPSENSEAQKREQLIAPFHQRDVAAHQFYCQPATAGNRLSDFMIVGRVHAYGRPGDAHHS